MQALALAISRKYGFTLTDSFNIFHVCDKGLKILVENDFVQQIPEGQHMTIQLDKVPNLNQNIKVGEMQLLY